LEVNLSLAASKHMNVSWDVIVGKDDHTHSMFAMDSDHI